MIGREPPVRDEHTGAVRASLCNALLMAEQGSAYARAWRERMPAALDGSWSNHSGFLSQALSEEMPDRVHVEPERSFFAFRASVRGLSALLQERHEIPPDVLSVHLWAHLWWERRRRDFSPAHAAWVEPPFVSSARSTVAELLRPYLPDRAPQASARGRGRQSGEGEACASLHQRHWTYRSSDDVSGYGIAADRCVAALRGAGVTVDWLPFVPQDGTPLFYAPG